MDQGAGCPGGSGGKTTGASDPQSCRSDPGTQCWVRVGTHGGQHQAERGGERDRETERVKDIDRHTETVREKTERESEKDRGTERDRERKRDGERQREKQKERWRETEKGQVASDSLNPGMLLTIPP